MMQPKQFAHYTNKVKSQTMKVHLNFCTLKNGIFPPFQEIKLKCWKHYLIINYQIRRAKKKLRYPRKKQSFCKEKDCFFLGYPKIFGPSYFETALVYFNFLSKYISVEVLSQGSNGSSTKYFFDLTFTDFQTGFLKWCPIFVDSFKSQ